MLNQVDGKLSRDELKKKIIKLRTELLTNYETKNAHKKDVDRVVKYFDTRFEALEENIELLKRYNNIMEEVNNKIVEFKDQILGEIVAMRQELTITLGHRDILENHEVRITELEQKSN